MMRFLPYNTDRKQLSRYLRNNSTLSEVLLWKELRAAQIMGYTFNRQKPLDNFIVDFYCKPLKLVIEIDGSTHDDDDVWVNDERRQAILEALDLCFLRFADDEVKQDMVKVLRAIENYITRFEEKNAPRPNATKKSRLK
jgi:very-short-patch-repair endonuclease